jgi:hypothetical protein
MPSKVAWLRGRALAAIQGAAGGLLLGFLLGTPPAAEAQVRPPTQRTTPGIAIQDRARLPTPPRRPSLARWMELYTQHGHDVDSLRAALAAERVRPLVDRICVVSGTHPAQVECEPLQDFLRNVWMRPESDMAFLNLAFNDAWERLGGAPGGGDLLYCGGATDDRFTHVMPRGRGSQGARVVARGTGPQKPSLAETSAMVDSCRGAQRASASRGLGGLYTPGSEGYRRAVGHAQAFLTGIAQSCDASVPTGFGREQLEWGGGQRRIDTAGDAMATGAGLTATIAQAAHSPADLVACAGAAAGGSKGACAAAVGGLVATGVGAVAQADGLTNEPSEIVQAFGLAADVLGGVLSAVALAGASSAAAAVLPAVGVATGVAAAGTAAQRYVLNPIYDRAVDRQTDWYASREPQSAPTPPTSDGAGDGRAPAGARPGTFIPAEDGKPSCKQLAERADRFNAYCSHAGNEWQSYDCMLFVARLNGCADPGVIRPAPGEDYQCTRPESAAEQWQAQCEQTERGRGLIGRPGGVTATASPRIATGAVRSCGQLARDRFDLDQRMRAQICTRVLTDDPSGYCSGLAGRP